MSQKPWYESLFENYANKYEQESFVQGTKGECDFLEPELSYNKSLMIIDVGCGTGRHAIELARRGYQVTGIDLSESMIKKAKIKNRKIDVNVDFKIKDALELNYNKEFDLNLILCEGA